LLYPVHEEIDNGWTDTGENITSLVEVIIVIMIIIIIIIIIYKYL